ncbi:hypothetical protein Tco_0892280 [Tanacetum coccineum]|uniref:Uncharacterized protein n=1 Tax=Tanacetum coccineum TaxID=301880 RepID=A0ABQ5C6V0_9ASTR
MLGENVTLIVTEEPPSHTERETDDMETKEIKNKVKKEKEPERPTRAIPILIVKSLMMPNPKLEMMSSPSTIKLTDTTFEIQIPQPTSPKLVHALKEVHPDSDALILVLYEINGKFFQLTETEVITVVQEEAKKIRLDPKIIISAKAGEKNNDKRNFDVHNPFKFTDFRITELDGLGPIIEKKKNSIVKALMQPLSKRYKRLKKIPKEHGIQYALPAPILEQAPSQSSGRKRKHIDGINDQDPIECQILPEAKEVDC